ncbi:MAG TPA: hypothetical protein VFW28_08095 [Micropepsaceae bacterium]|nr:hypothetical protein [Micropepsaceae bacterium]
MKLQALSFLILVAIPAAGIAPAVGQVPQAIGGGVHMPEFSGMWVHPFFPGIEPPESGPGPVFNRLRRPNGQVNNNQWVGDDSNPILKPEAAEIVRQHGAVSQSGMTYPTPSNRCWPSGVPYIFFQPGMEMLQRPNEIIFLYLRNHEFRRVRMNDRHPANVTPSWYGDSIGHYEGDTLVIDTVGMKADRPMAMVDMYGTPFSSALHIVERYRMVDHDAAQAALARNLKINPRVPDTRADLTYKGKQLQLVFTVDDQRFFTMPWSGVITYEKPGMQWEENVCAENPFEFYAVKNDAVIPTAATPDF